MKNLNLIFALLITLIGHSFGQIGCISGNSSSFVQDNGDGTCTYNVTLTVASGNGASGVATFSIDGTQVYEQAGCTCNTTDITFPVTFTCGSSTAITLFYNAPGNGNDCNGSTGAIILPVEWMSFDLSEKDSGIELTWSTASELNNDYFEVERSTEGKVWSSISSKIESAHYSNEINRYSFEDDRPQNGLNYYRVKQTDFDGNHSYTYTLEYFYRDFESAIIFPNPVEDVLSINTSSMSSWRIYTIQGLLIMEGDTEQINTVDLVSGTYFIKIDSKPKSKYIKFLKL